MAVRRFNPKTQSLRGTRLEDRSGLSKKKGPKSLTVAKRKITGRNNQGKITIRHRGGAHKRRLRVIDFKRDKYDIVGEVTGFFYDPNRSANLALVQYPDGEKRYIIAPRGLEVGAKIVSGEKTDVIVGNAMKLKNIPSGTEVHCVELQAGKGAKLGRAAGQVIIVQGVDTTGRYVQLKMSSGEIRLVHGESMAVIGQVGNEDRMNVKLGKAGRKRRMGWRPEVRGMVMHPAQHPHGGGEGKGVIGGPAKDIYGNRVGVKTRRNKRTDKYIVRMRRSKTRPFAKK